MQSSDTCPCGSECNAELGQLPKSEATPWHPFKYTEHQMRAYAAQQVAAERERWEKSANASLEVMDGLPQWSNAGHACNMLRACLGPNKK